MLFRFSLYGFLKNLRFFDAFFLLFLREKGLSFTDIGILFAFREICVNTLNVPTGAIADLYGRKRSLILALVAYVVSFAFFSFSSNFALLCLAMFLYGIGESFRSGTHKAMIFDYLREQNRVHDKTKIYGITRSWSQRGSALSALIGAAIVYFGSGFQHIFLYSMIPYVFGIWNIAMYPASLDKRNETGANMKGVFTHLWKTMKKCWESRPLRSLIIRSTFYEGQYRSTKDYLQILIQMQIIAMPALMALGHDKGTAIGVAIVYTILYMLSSYASAWSHHVSSFFKSDDRAANAIIRATAILLATSATALYFGYTWIAIIAFVLVFNLENVMRPIVTAIYDDISNADEQVTILSIESQAHSVGIFILAPIVGHLADHYGPGASFAFCACILAGLLLIIRRKKIDKK